MSTVDKALLTVVFTLVVLLGVALHLGANNRQNYLLDHCEWSSEFQRLECGK